MKNSPRITLITRKKKKTIRAIREICGKMKNSPRITLITRKKKKTNSWNSWNLWEKEKYVHELH